MYKMVEKLIESSYFKNSIITLIILNGITMGMATSSDIMSKWGWFIDKFDVFVVSVFTIEIVLRIYIHRSSFFKDPWSLFDFAIVTISLVPANESFSIFRILRVLRLLRLITVVPQMKKIVEALINVVPSMISIAGLMSLIFYIFSIMATNLYGKTFPQWFGSLGDSFYTLFQIMTLESWSMGIVRPVMEQHPYAWVFFLPFIFIATFVMINLIIAVIVDAMSILTQKEEEHIIEEVKVSEDEIHKDIKSLKQEIKELKDLLIQKNNIKE